MLRALGRRETQKRRAKPLRRKQWPPLCQRFDEAPQERHASSPAAALCAGVAHALPCQQKAVRTLYAQRQAPRNRFRRGIVQRGRRASLARFVRADDAHFRFQPHAGVRLHAALHFRNQLEHICGGGAAKVDDEPGVLLAHLRAADGKAF